MGLYLVKTELSLTQLFDVRMMNRWKQSWRSRGRRRKRLLGLQPLCLSRW